MTLQERIVQLNRYGISYKALSKALNNIVSPTTIRFYAVGTQRTINVSDYKLLTTIESLEKILNI